jgi:hypothetical protein
MTRQNCKGGEVWCDGKYSSWSVAACGVDKCVVVLFVAQKVSADMGE